MEKNYGYTPPFMDYNNMPPPGYFSSSTYNVQDMSDIEKEAFFNPMTPYEQAFSYYRYLCMQMDYKIKCKEYENLCKNAPNSYSNSSTVNHKSSDK